MTAAEENRNDCLREASILPVPHRLPKPEQQSAEIPIADEQPHQYTQLDKI